MGAQHELQARGVFCVDVERILHRARRMVLRIVQRGEVVPVGLDLGTVGHIEADRAEDLLDALPGADHRMDTARRASPAGQRDIECFFGQARLQLRAGQLRAARVERRLELRLRGIDERAGGLAFLDRERTQALEERGQLPRLAEIARLGVFERGRVAGKPELA